MSEAISYLQVLEHERLCERLASLRRTVRERGAPDSPASPMLAFAASALLGDIYRLISREPGARALPRLDRRALPTHQALAAMLQDARLALDAFAHRHRDHDGEYDGGWLTREAMADFE